MSQDDKSKLLKGHRERLRKRLEREPLSLADYEVMELLLGLAIPRRDTKLLAMELIRRFKNIRGALDARPDELVQIAGFGPGLLALWRLTREIMARYSSGPLEDREVLSTPEAVAVMARQRLGNLPEEESWLALVNAQNRLIYWERLRRGGVSSVVIQPRDVLEAALLRKASGIILIHNHPGGSPYPSKSDIALTEEIRNLAPRLGLRFLDHIIVTTGDCYSIQSNKLLRDREEE
ncbi:MAG: DNA repair protein RadC [Desulfovibrio sp.]|nr:DNA repair protein RadC [Desulfovibrio sp.]